MGEIPDLFLRNRIQQNLSHLGLSYVIVIGTGSSVGTESACRAGDLGSISGSGRSPGEGNGHSLQYSSLKNPQGQRSLQVTFHGVAKSWTRLSD